MVSRLQAEHCEGEEDQGSTLHISLHETIKSTKLNASRY